MSFGPTTRITFERVVKKETRTGRCPDCGKKKTRIYRAEQTVNPFNKNEDGSIKTYDEVAQAVDAELARLCELPFMCARCEEIRSYNKNTERPKEIDGDLS